MAGVARLAAGRADPTVGSALGSPSGTGVADAAVDVVARLDRVAGAAVGAASAATAGAALLAAAALAGAFLPAAALLVAGLLAVGVTVTSEDATLRGAAAATARWLPESTSTVIPCSSKARTTVLSRRAGTPAVSNAVRRSAPAMLPRVAPRAKSCCRAGWENSVGKGADDFAGPEDTRDTGTDYLSQYTLTSAHGRARPSGRASEGDQRGHIHHTRRPARQTPAGPDSTIIKRVPLSRRIAVPATTLRSLCRP